MGMPISIHLRGASALTQAGERAVAQAFAVFREMDRIFSTYRDDSDLMRLRREEVDVSEVSPLVKEALAIGERAERDTLGAFTTLLPTGEGDLAFDPTGLVKGWAVDRAAEVSARPARHVVVHQRRRGPARRAVRRPAPRR